MTRVFAVDDHPVVLAGLRQLLSAAGCKVVGEASQLSAARQALDATSVDVVVMEVRFADGDAFDLLNHLRQTQPKLPVLMYTRFENPKFVSKAINGGAAGYILKILPIAHLVDAIKKAAAGETVWTREDIRRTSVALAAPRLTADVEAALTQRETEVLRELVRGRTNKEIAQNLKISYETVKEHVQHLLDKIGVSDRTQAAVWAVRQNL